MEFWSRLFWSSLYLVVLTSVLRLLDLITDPVFFNIIILAGLIFMVISGYEIRKWNKFKIQRVKEYEESIKKTESE